MGDLSKKVLDLDMVAEQRLLTMEEWDERIETEHKMEKLIHIENLTWKQRVGKKLDIARGCKFQVFPPIY